MSGRAVPYRIAPRRLSWQTRRGLREMCASAWQWQVRLQENAVALSD